MSAVRCTAGVSPAGPYQFTLTHWCDTQGSPQRPGRQQYSGAAIRWSAARD
jgi:hypothetical protein